MMLCNRYPKCIYLITGSLYALTDTYQSLLLQTLATTILLSIPVNLALVDFTCK